MMGWRKADAKKVSLQRFFTSPRGFQAMIIGSFTWIVYEATTVIPFHHLINMNMCTESYIINLNIDLHLPHEQHANPEPSLNHPRLLCSLFTKWISMLNSHQKTRKKRKKKTAPARAT